MLSFIKGLFMFGLSGNELVKSFPPEKSSWGGKGPLHCPVCVFKIHTKIEKLSQKNHDKTQVITQGPTLKSHTIN